MSRIKNALSSLAAGVGLLAVMLTGKSEEPAEPQTVLTGKPAQGDVSAPRSISAPDVAARMQKELDGTDLFVG